MIAVGSNGQASTLNPWITRSGELVQWVQSHIIVRDDAYVEHYIDHGQLQKRWVTRQLDSSRLARHFSTSTQDDVACGNIISLAALALDPSGTSSFARELTIDIDCHDAIKGNPTATYRASTIWFQTGLALGFHPILESITSASKMITY